MADGAAPAPGPPPATRLVLVRHGEARAAVDRVVGGHAGCKGLSPRGRRQAEALRDRLARTGEVEADVLYASVLPRAVETAEIIAPALGGLPVRQDCDLCEVHAGECDGMSWDDYDARYGVDWSVTPYEPVSPGGETLVDFRMRSERALLRLAAEHAGRRVVVACHGGIVGSSMVCFLGLPIQRMPPVDLHIDNTSITEWERRDGRWHLLRYNDAAHLADIDR